MAGVGLGDSASTRKGDGMASGPPAAVRPAATVVLHRRGAEGLEVFWVRRGELLRRELPRAKEGAFADFLAAHGLTVDARAFTPAGRSVTPPGLVRFDARFYLAELPAG